MVKDYMNNPSTVIKRWGVVVIQSLKSEDRKTGENLFKEILQYKEYYQKESFSSFYDVHSKQDFCFAIKTVEKTLVEGDIITLHLESHGCEAGIGLSNDEIVDWKTFYDLIRPINVKTGHLLFVVMAMCKSIDMISSINPYARAPYRAFICTTRNVYPQEIYNGFVAFYEKYFNLLDIEKAIKALQNEVIDENGYSPFQIMTAEYIFDKTFETNRDLSEVAEMQLGQLNIPITESTKKLMTNSIRQLLREIHDKFYDYFNFKDIF